MARRIRVEASKCIGCKTCELACSFKHTGTFAPALSRIHNEVFLEEGAFVTVTCQQCDDPWCMKACPSNAIIKRADTGVVEIIAEKCVGCRTCVSACPFGMITYAAWKGKADKCDLCGGDYPECVAFCPTGCLTFEEEDTPTRTKVLNFANAIKEGRLEV